MLSSKLSLWEDAWNDSYDQALQRDPNPGLRDIHIATLKKILKAAKLIKFLYERRMPILAFTFYINFVKKYGRTVDLKRIERFQFEDMLMAILNQECMWLRTRRGGKTRDLSLVNVFWVIVGKEPIWFAPQSDQLKQANIYFLANPFFSHSSNDYHHFHGCKNPLEMSNLTLGKSASKGKDCITYDEGAKVQKGLMIYDYYKFSRVIIAGKLWEGDKHILYATTAARNSAAEEQYTMLMAMDSNLVSKHDYTDCWWITDEWVEQERMSNLNDPWFVEQEYFTLFVNRGGEVFDNIIIRDFEEYSSLPINRMGMDINEKETTAFIHENETEIYIMAEHEFAWNKDMNCFAFIQPNAKFEIKGRPYQLNHEYSMEVEGMGFNQKLALWITQNVPMAYANMEWSDIVKGERLHMAKKKIIYIDPRVCPKILEDLRNTEYHPYKSGVYLKDRKHPCHWLETVLHGVNSLSGRFVHSEEFKPERDELPEGMKQNLRKYYA